MNSPSPVPRIRDSRTFHARWKGSVTSARSDSGTPTPSSSTVTASHRPSALAATTTGLSSDAYFRALPTRFAKTSTDTTDVDVEVGQIGGSIDHEAICLIGHRQVSAQTRDEGFE